MASHRKAKKAKKDTGFHFTEKLIFCAIHGNLKKSQAKEAGDGTT